MATNNIGTITQITGAVVDVRFDDVDGTGGAVEVDAITAVSGHERVYHRHLGTARSRGARPCRSRA